ncbi:MAG: hypothetical protein HYY06_32370 [Deltaproteobacteria bacterium]|nr:hypothetical protein [Deltaproteobacteria bacterium]
MGRRHGFFQRIHGGRLTEVHRRAGEQAAEGRIEEAAYFDPGRPARLFGWLPFVSRGGARLRWPFDERGRDVLGLFAEPPPELGDGAGAATGIRRIAGRARPLSASGVASELILVDDTWVAPFWRVAEGVDFVVDREGQGAVVVSFGLAPLVVAVPERVALSDQIARLDPYTRRLLPAGADISGHGSRVRVLPGDAVEVWGVCRDLSESRRTFDLGGPADYRTAPRPARVIGDEDGTRLIIRVTG